MGYHMWMAPIINIVTKKERVWKISIIFTAEFPRIFEEKGPSRIVKGFDTEEPLPYQLSLEYYVTNSLWGGEWTHFCGATLITKSYAISALHCFVVQVEMSRKISGDELYFKDFRVVAGKYYKNPITLNKNAQVSTLMLQLSDYS